MCARECLGAAACMLFLGCGGTSVAPVSGQVTLDGKPLPKATVSFQPIAEAKKLEVGPASTAETDAQGNFTLHLLTASTLGAAVGLNRVQISAPDGPPPDPTNDNSKPRRDLVPARYNSKTELKFEVPREGSTAANFALTSK